MQLKKQVLINETKLDGQETICTKTRQDPKKTAQCLNPTAVNLGHLKLAEG